MRRKETGQNDLAWKPQLSPPTSAPLCQQPGGRGLDQRSCVSPTVAATWSHHHSPGRVRGGQSLAERESSPGVSRALLPQGKATKQVQAGRPLSRPETHRTACSPPREPQSPPSCSPHSRHPTAFTSVQAKVTFFLLVYFCFLFWKTQAPQSGLLMGQTADSPWKWRTLNAEFWEH